MFIGHWGLNEAPFEESLDVLRFEGSAGHEEALARLSFLAEQRRPFGFLLGEEGTGKSLLLAVLADEVRDRQQPAAVIDLLGLNADEMLWQVAVTLDLAPADAAGSRTLWRSISDHLSAMQQARVPTVLIFDHLERAGSGCLSALERLLHLQATCDCWTTFLVSARNADAFRFAGLMSEFSSLRVELPPLDAAETDRYVTARLNAAGCVEHPFDRSASAEIFRQTGGVPRAINRLCELSLLAAIGSGRERVDAAIVRHVAAELRGRFQDQRRAA